MRNIKKQSGFTIIEMSIVVTILVLLLGSVLIAKELIEAARVRAIISQITNFETVRFTFKQKFSCQPGDCLNAADYGLGVGGNGNGVVSDLFLQEGSRFVNEIQTFWAHLDNAELISDDLSFRTPPLADGDSHISILFEAPRTNYYILGVNPKLVPVNTHFNMRFFPRDVSNIDQKIDDGFPEAGSVLAYDQGRIQMPTGELSIFPPAGGEPPCLLGTTPNKDYNYSSDYLACIATVKFRDGF